MLFKYFFLNATSWASWFHLSFLEVRDVRTLFLSKKRIAYLAITVILLLPLLSTGCACFSISLIGKTRALDETVVSGKGKDKILLMDISGVLSAEEKGGFLPFQKEASIVSRIREEL